MHCKVRKLYLNILQIKKYNIIISNSIQLKITNYIFFKLILIPIEYSYFITIDKYYYSH